LEPLAGTQLTLTADLLTATNPTEQFLQFLFESTNPQGFGALAFAEPLAGTQLTLTADLLTATNPTEQFLQFLFESTNPQGRGGGGLVPLPPV
jgi:glycerol-3-phosphate responsive antiterminator